jgi:hypothetical protein
VVSGNMSTYYPGKRCLESGNWNMCNILLEEHEVTSTGGGIWEQEHVVSRNRIIYSSFWDQDMLTEHLLSWNMEHVVSVKRKVVSGTGV